MSDYLRLGDKLFIPTKYGCVDVGFGSTKSVWRNRPPNAENYSLGTYNRAPFEWCQHLDDYTNEINATHQMSIYDHRSIIAELEGKRYYSIEGKAPDETRDTMKYPLDDLSYDYPLFYYYDDDVSLDGRFIHVPSDMGRTVIEFLHFGDDSNLW